MLYIGQVLHTGSRNENNMGLPQAASKNVHIIGTDDKNDQLLFLCFINAVSLLGQQVIRVQTLVGLLPLTLELLGGLY